MGLFENLASGFAVAISVSNLFYCAIGAILGTAIGVLPGPGASGDDRPSPAGDPEDGTGFRRDHARGDILRRHVRRLHHIDPLEHPGGGGLGGHLSGRIQAGPEGEGRGGPGDLGPRLLHRRVARRPGNFGHGPDTGVFCLEVRSARVLLSGVSRPDDGDLPVRRIGPEGVDDGRPGPSSGDRRARSGGRNPAVHPGCEPADGRCRLRGDGHGDVRRRRDPLQPGGLGNPGGLQNDAQGILPPARTGGSAGARCSEARSSVS